MALEVLEMEELHVLDAEQLYQPPAPVSNQEVEEGHELGVGQSGDISRSALTPLDTITPTMTTSTTTHATAIEVSPVKPSLGHASFLAELNDKKANLRRPTIADKDKVRRTSMENSPAGGAGGGASTVGSATTTGGGGGSGGGSTSSSFNALALKANEDKIAAWRDFIREVRQYQMEVSALAVRIGHGQGFGSGFGSVQGQGASALLGRGKYSAVYQAHIQCLCEGEEPDDEVEVGGQGHGHGHIPILPPPLLGTPPPEPAYDR